jgi:hypothetical protein
MWAALIAIADQGHALGGRGTLDGASQTLPALYSARMTGDFHDITQGFNGYYAGPGYDLVTGRGSPMAFNIVRDLVQVTPSTSYALSASTRSGGVQVVPDVAAPTRSSPSVVAAAAPGRLLGAASPELTSLAIAPWVLDQPAAFQIPGGLHGKQQHEAVDLALERALSDLDPVAFA